MSELDRLIEIARSLPQAKVHALLGVAEADDGLRQDEEFLRRINSAPPLEVDNVAQRSVMKS
jgi:hypothetical protein